MHQRLTALTQSFDDIAQCVERSVDVGPLSDAPFVVCMVVGVGSLTETEHKDENTLTREVNNNNNNA